VVFGNARLRQAEAGGAAAPQPSSG